MGDAVEFPLKDNPTWSELETGTKKAFQELQTPGDVVNDICGWVKETYDKIKTPPTSVRVMCFIIARSLNVTPQMTM